MQITVAHSLTAPLNLATPDLLLHGWGSDGRAMTPLAQVLRLAFPQAAVLAPDAPTPFERGGTARQWYGVDDLDMAVWPQRVAGVLPLLHTWVWTPAIVRW